MLTSHPLYVVGAGGIFGREGLDQEGGHSAHSLSMSLTLLKYCEVAKTTVAQVARDADLDPKWLYKVAKGERGFSPETAAKIQEATGGGVTPSDLNKVRMEWLAAKQAAAELAGVGKKASERPFAKSAEEPVV